MLYTRQAAGTVSQIVERLGKAFTNNHFGILGRIDLRAKMVEKGVPFAHDCVILEVCNPKQAKKVLEKNLAVSTSLPCRISVYEEGGEVTVATVKPTALLAMYEGPESLVTVAKEVEDTIIAIIDEACAAASKGS